MSRDKFPVTKFWAERAWVDDEEYTKMYNHSIDAPVNFWNEQGKRIDWIKPYTLVKNVSFQASDL